MKRKKTRQFRQARVSAAGKFRPDRFKLRVLSALADGLAPWNVADWFEIEENTVWAFWRRTVRDLKLGGLSMRDSMKLARRNRWRLRAR
jgi:hypothetical protein